MQFFEHDKLDEFIDIELCDRCLQLRGRIGLRVSMYGLVVVRKRVQRFRNICQMALKSSLSYVVCRVFNIAEIFLHKSVLVQENGDRIFLLCVLSYKRYTVVSRMVTFPDGFFPGKTFPG